MVLSKKEKSYLEYMMKTVNEKSIEENSKSEDYDIKFTEKEKYDMNYRLKTKFNKIHEDYWQLIKFFKHYETYFNKRDTKMTSHTIEIAKSQIKSTETINKTFCYFCRRNSEEIKIVEMHACQECINEMR